MKREWTEEDKIAWQEGKINTISNEPEDEDDKDGEESYSIVTYYPEFNITVFTHRFFEGFFYDDEIDVLEEIKGGRVDWNEIEQYF